MSTATSNERHFIALAIIVFIYILPLMLPEATILYWLRHILISCLCMAMLYCLSKLERGILIPLFILEITVMIAVILASKSQWFNSRFDSIMLLIFCAEDLAVVGSAIFGSTLRNHKFGGQLRKLLHYVYNYATRNFLGN